MTDKNKGNDQPGTHKPFKVIEGGKVTDTSNVTDITKGRVGKAESGLTLKQEAFAQGLANGLTNTEAYRQAYDTSGMKANVVHNEACKLAATPKITDRMTEILQEKRNRNSMLSEKQSDRVWRNVWRLAEGQGVPPSVQQAALALAAKMAGMLTDKVEIKNEFPDSQSIEAELLQRLQKLSK